MNNFPEGRQREVDVLELLEVLKLNLFRLVDLFRSSQIA